MLIRSYKYRLYPTVSQAQTLAAWQEACHEIQRLCILQRRIAWTKRRTLYSGQPALKPQPSRFSQGREVTRLRHEYPYLAAVPADTMQQIVARVDDAYQRMINERQHGRWAVVRWAQRSEQIGLAFRGASQGTALTQITGRHAYVQVAWALKLQPLRLRYHRPIPPDSEIRQAHITRAADGWYITLVCRIPVPTPAPPAPRAINGVDLGCIHEGMQQRVAVVDDGRVYRTHDGLKRNAKRLATLQKLVSPRRVRGAARHADPHSKRTTRRRERIARLHQRIARQREHTLQYTARRLVDTATVTVFEDINWKALRGAGGRKQRTRTKSGSRRASRRGHRGLNRSMSTASPGRLVTLTNHKAVMSGRQVAKVDARGTSQRCSICGCQGTTKWLNVRRWVCAACGAEHDRDVNAAQNIRQRFEADTGPCRSGVRGEGSASPASERSSMNREGGRAATVRATHDHHSIMEAPLSADESTSGSDPMAEPGQWPPGTA